MSGHGHYIPAKAAQELDVIYKQDKIQYYQKFPSEVKSDPSSLYQEYQFNGAVRRIDDSRSDIGADCRDCTRLALRTK